MRTMIMAVCAALAAASVAGCSSSHPATGTSGTPTDVAASSSASGAAPGTVTPAGDPWPSASGIPPAAAGTAAALPGMPKCAALPGTGVAQAQRACLTASGQRVLAQGFPCNHTPNMLVFDDDTENATFWGLIGHVWMKAALYHAPHDVC